MARKGHRRTNTTWRTRSPNAKYDGGWTKSKTKKHRVLKAAGVTSIPKPKPSDKFHGPVHPVTVVKGEVRETAQVWWWTIARGGECDSCSTVIAKGEHIAYRAHDKQTRCGDCVKRENLEPRESKRYLAALKAA